MEKRSRPRQGFYKSIETPSIPRGRKCERKPEVLGTSKLSALWPKRFLTADLTTWSNGMDTVPAKTPGSRKITCRQT